MKNQNDETAKMDLLEAIEQIILLSEDSKLSPTFYANAAPYIEYLNNRLGLSSVQSVLLSIFIDKYDESYISQNDIGEHLGCRSVSILRLSSDFEELEKREFIRCCRTRDRLIYRVPSHVIDNFKNNKPDTSKAYNNLTFNTFFEELKDILDMLDNQEISYENAQLKIASMIEQNEQLNVVQQLKEMDFNQDDLILFLTFSHLYVNNHDNRVLYCDIKFLYENDNEAMGELTNRQLSSRSHNFFEWDIITNNCNEGLIDIESYCLTDNIKKKFFPEININTSTQEKNDKGLLKPEKIEYKEMFYDNNTQEQILTVQQLIQEENYVNIRSRLKEAGMRCGFTCLFYGAPGTGKTESALQLARTSGRSIMQVDLANIRSAWVGESEKNIKAIFDRYRELAQECTLTPILLFNEADGIINKRNENAQRSIDKMENTMQNIILQEIENFDGILFATTNLTQNIDKAFERRFLYKIEFEKPSIKARKSIWHTMIPSLDNSTIELLAHKYDFSGGQIENIARHYTIDSILFGTGENELSRIMGHCDNEMWNTSVGKKVGF